MITYIENLFGKSEGKILLVKFSVDGRISECILQKQDGKFWTGFIWLMTGNSGRLL
jgi:hypothetical protein